MEEKLDISSYKETYERMMDYEEDAMLGKHLNLQGDKDKKEDKELKSVYEFDNKVVVTGNSLESVLEQTVNTLEKDDPNNDPKEDGETKEIKEVVYDGAKEYNQEVDNMMSNNVEIKSNPLDNKTELEEVFDEFIDEYDRIVKKAINSVK